MSEYVFRDAPGYGCADDVMMEDGITSAREYYSQENSDHYGTLHERIVRCRDCAFFVADVSTVDVNGNVIATGNICDFTELWANQNGFCSWAERRDSLE